MSSEDSVGASSVSIYGEDILTQAQRLAAQMQSALETRAMLDQAVGVMMGRTGDTEREALDRLLALSRADQRTVAATARRILEGSPGAVSENQSDV